MTRCNLGDLMRSRNAGRNKAGPRQSKTPCRSGGHNGLPQRNPTTPIKDSTMLNIPAQISKMRRKQFPQLIIVLSSFWTTLPKGRVFVDQYRPIEKYVLIISPSGELSTPFTSALLASFNTAFPTALLLLTPIHDAHGPARSLL